MRNITHSFPFLLRKRQTDSTLYIHFIRNSGKQGRLGHVFCYSISTCVHSEKCILFFIQEGLYGIMMFSRLEGHMNSLIWKGLNLSSLCKENKI